MNRFPVFGPGMLSGLFFMGFMLKGFFLGALSAGIAQGTIAVFVTGMITISLNAYINDKAP